MAEINEGGLSFEIELENSRANHMLEETLRRIQGLSDGTTTAGEVMQKAFEELIDSAKDASGDIEMTLGVIDQAADLNRQSIRELQAEYDNLAKVAGQAYRAGDDDAYHQAVRRQEQIKGEITVRNKLLNELSQQADELAKIEQEYEKERQKAEKSAKAQNSLRTQIKNVRDEMAALRNEAEKNGVTLDENTGRYAELRDELGRLYTIQTDMQKQATILSNTQEKQFQGIISGLSGLAGGFSAATGTISLFAGKNDDLQKVMTRVQSVMAITIGLQQVSQTLYKDSAFQLVTMARLKNSWTKAQGLLNTQLGIGVGLSKALMLSGIGVLLAGIAALVIVYDKWKKKQEEVNALKKEYIQIESDVARSMASEKINVEQLQRIAADHTKSLDQRNKAIERMKAIMPDYNGYIDKEGTLVDNANTALKNYLTTLYKVEKAKKLISQMEDVDAQIVEAESADVKGANIWQKMMAGFASANDKSGTLTYSNIIEDVKRQNQAAKDKIVDDLKDKKEQLEKDLNDLASDKSVFDILFPDKAGKTKTSGVEVDQFTKDLEQMKQRYADYAKWMNSTDETIRNSASTAFADILQNGETYLDSLKKMRDELTGQPITVDSANQLLKLNNEIAEQTQLQTDKEEKKQQEHVKKLIEDYGLYYDERVRLHEEYLNDIEALNKQLETETDPEKKKVIETAKENRTKTYDKDLKAARSGDPEYDAMLKEYATFEQKKQAIIDDYTEKRKVAQEKGNTDLIEQLNKAQAKALSSLATDELTGSEMWASLFGNMDELTISQIDTLVNEIESKFDELSGVFDPIDLNAVRTKLNEARAVLIQDNPFKAIGDSLKQIFSDGAGESKDATRNIKTDWKNLASATQSAFDFVQDAVDSADFLKDAIGDVGATAISSLATIATVSIAVATAIKTAEKASVILTIIQAALAVVQAVANVVKSIIASQDKKIEKSIQKHAENVDNLQRSYENLEKAIDKALGSGRYTDTQKAIKNLEQQQKELAKQADLERSKKKTDKDKVREYENALQDAKDKQKELIEQLREDILGLDARSAAQELGAAFVDAFREGEDAVEAFGKKADDIVGNIIQKMLVQKLLEQPIGQIFDRYSKKWYSDNGDFIGFDAVIRDANAMGSEIKGVGEGFSRAMESLPDEIKKYFTGEAAGSDANSWTGAIKGASEESVKFAAGQLNAMRINQLEATNLLRQQLAHLSTIANNTTYNRYLKHLESIENRMARMESKDSLRSQGLQ